MGKELEAHIVKEYTSWTQDRINDYRDGDKYNSVWIEFPPNRYISCGELRSFEIHKGNMTSVYFEETKFKPQKLILLAVPNLNKHESRPHHCNYVDYFVHDLYESPEGIIYSGSDIIAWGKEDDETYPVKVPFDYQIKSMLPVPKANKLLKRNPEVLSEIEGRLTELQEMKDFLQGKLK